MKPRISILGTGRMGSALARAFLKQGYETSGWNRTKSRCGSLAELGAHIAPSVLDAVAAAEIIVVNVSDYVASDALLRPDSIASEMRRSRFIRASGCQLATET